MSEFAGFPVEALIFFEGLEADNSKAYWTDHRETYERAVRAPMLALLAALEPEFGEPHVFRPYRDVRFSKDKSPYKTAIGAHCGRGGYVQVSANGLMAASGYWQTASDQVERLRAAVADDVRGPALEAIVERLRAAGYEISGTQLSTRPRGYAADHPRIELLRYKTLTAHRDFGEPPWLAEPACVEQVASAWRDMRQLTDWLDQQVGPTRLPQSRRR
ncbi:DUF2461 domain-containing protein [Pseudofrankia sp. BMG5.36]|uniref:DUF2461 domain-containing protein n=1 Tax=Pseudofrankia sp. BMG5.36 TaxID=1834512 RepID=UPI0008D9E7F8|nr:DUF2461 domain-containing protein [Pseudofrankia sp. BMG5.36]OHV42494.1 TIGR02453 family protein [Pseudofrankia sp. BMG5.36]